jgi:hypothetical protein
MLQFIHVACSMKILVWMISFSNVMDNYDSFILHWFITQANTRMCAHVVDRNGLDNRVYLIQYNTASFGKRSVFCWILSEYIHKITDESNPIQLSSLRYRYTNECRTCRCFLWSCLTVNCVIVYIIKCYDWNIFLFQLLIKWLSCFYLYSYE